MPENKPSESPRLAAVLALLDSLVNWERRDRSAGGMERTLAPIQDVLGRLGDPQKSFRAVHVAGTKGKGSVAALVAAGLARAGLRAGVYTSPHVERMGERVRIDGRDATAEELAAALERAWAAREAATAEGSPGREATWFDLVTAAAFERFRACGVEWAAVECGLGGRLDSTNVLAAPVCVVTNVDLEHTAVLGSTRAAIAAEKGAILPPGGVLVTGARARPGAGPEEDPRAVLARIAAERGGRLRVVEAAGDLEARNRALARAVLEELGALGVAGPAGAVGPALLDEATARAARLPGRLERFEVGGTPVVLDAAHVASSVAEVLELAPALAGRSGPPQLVLALGRDKDLGAVLKALRTRVDRVHCTSVSTGPLRSADELAEAARLHGLDARPHPSTDRALAAALDSAGGAGWVMVLGSFYLAGEVRPLLARGAVADVPGESC